MCIILYCIYVHISLEFRKHQAILWGYAWYYCCMPSSPDLLYGCFFVPALFGTSIPTSFNIYVNVFILVYNGEHWNTRTSWHYSVVGEIKSSKGGKSQNQEQMVGLWQNNQKVILGLVVDPTHILDKKFFAFIKDVKRVLIHCFGWSNQLLKHLNSFKEYPPPPVPSDEPDNLTPPPGH